MSERNVRERIRAASSLDISTGILEQRERKTVSDLEIGQVVLTSLDQQTHLGLEVASDLDLLLLVPLGLLVPRVAASSV